MEDGSFAPVEQIKTVIERDGSKSVTRESYPPRSKSVVSNHGTAPSLSILDDDQRTSSMYSMAMNKQNARGNSESK